MTLGEQLLLALKRANLSRENIRSITGYSLPTIRKALNDDKKVSLEVIERIAKAANVKIKYTVG